jgi:hypothetical protein
MRKEVVMAQSKVVAQQWPGRTVANHDKTRIRIFRLQAEIRSLELLCMKENTYFK